MADEIFTMESPCVDTHKTERKFSSENWKIIEELREEKRKLQIFNASKISVIEELDEDEVSKCFSPSEYICKQSDQLSPFIHNGHAINVSDYCASSPIVQQIMNATYIKPADLLLNENETVTSSNESFQRGSLSSDVQRSTLHSMPNTSSTSESKTSSQTGCKQSSEMSYGEESMVSSHFPASLYSSMMCLFNIAKFKSFVAVLSEKVDCCEVNMQEKFPTISFFTDAFKAFINDNKTAHERLRTRFQMKSLSASLNQESLSALLFSMLELFHEEILQGRKEDCFPHVCIENCRYLHKSTHTAVSHLFRGHLKRKLQCSCGYSTVHDEPFTSLTIPCQEIEEKLLFLHIVSECQERSGANLFSVFRVSFLVNCWSTVSSLKERIVSETPSLADVIVVCVLYSNGSVNLPIDRSMLFDLMSTDGQIWVFDSSLGDLSINIGVESSTSLLTYASLSACSIPRLFDDGSHKHGKKSSARVFLWGKHMTALHWLVVKLPRFSHGLHLFERVGRLFNITSTDFQHTVIIIRNKRNQCVFCFQSTCEGCPVQLSDKVIISDQYSMLVTLPQSVDQLFKVSDDVSITLNQPKNMVTMEESLSMYSRQNEEQACPQCFQLSWKPSKTVALKCPEALIINLPVLQSQKLLYKQRRLRPFTNNENVEYSLSGVIVNDGDHTSFIRQKKTDVLKATTWLMCCYDETKEVECLPCTAIQMLFYVRNKDTTAKRSVIQTKILNKMKNSASLCASSKFSVRTGLVHKNFGQKTHNRASETDLFSSGVFTSGTFESHSQCGCTQCQCLDRMQRQMIASRSSVDAQSQFTRCNSVSESQCTQSSRSSRASNHEILELKLHQQIRQHNLKGVVESLNDGADVNHLLKGTTALLLSAGMPPPFGSVFVQLCLEHGADPNLSSRDGFTPLHMAVTWKQEDTVKLLLKAGASPNFKDGEGRSCFNVINLNGGTGGEQILRLLRGETNVKEQSFNEVSITHLTSRSTEEITKELNSSPSEQSCNLRNISLTTDSKADVSTEINFLKESIVSDEFTVNSNVTFNGSRRNTWLSFFLCGNFRRRYKESQFKIRIGRLRCLLSRKDR